MQYVAIIRTSGIVVLRTWSAYVWLVGVIWPMWKIRNSSRDEYNRALLPFYQSFSLLLNIVNTTVFQSIKFTNLISSTNGFLCTCLVQYVRMDAETKMGDVLHLLLEVWDMKKPNLLISVIGGTENFRLKSKLKDIFRRGMIKASKSTGLLFW